MIVLFFSLVLISSVIFVVLLSLLLILINLINKLIIEKK